MFTLANVPFHSPHPQASGSDKHIRTEFAKSNSKPPKHARVWYSATPAALADPYASAGLKRPAHESNPYAQYAAPYASYAQQYPGFAQQPQNVTAQGYAQPDWNAYNAAAGYAGSSGAGYYGQQQQHAMYSAAPAHEQRSSNNPP